MQGIEFTKNPNIIDINFLTRKINEETSQHGEARPFGFFIRDDKKQIIAGANGFIIYGAVYTDQLWVDKEHRNQNFARKIMQKVHEFGRSQECKMATIQTMNFQNSKEFYEKLGYIEDFQRPGYVNNSNCIFMKMHL